MVNGASSHMTKEDCSWYVAGVVYVNMCVSLCTPIQNIEEETGCLPLMLPLPVLLSCSNVSVDLPYQLLPRSRITALDD